jgi:hypothetical protein
MMGRVLKAPEVTEAKTYMDAGAVMTKAKAVREATRD